MKTYKIELTAKQLQKLSTFILMYEDKLIDNAEVYQQESKAVQAYSEESIKVFKSNVKWYKDTYKIIHEIREYIDQIPF